MSTRKRPVESAAELRADLVEHARRIISRDGPEAFTMRALANEAGCALGLPYKVFADRREIVAEILQAELNRLAAAGQELMDRAGKHDLVDNLVWYADVILGSAATPLASEVMSDPNLMERFRTGVEETGQGPGSFERAFARYLEVEKTHEAVDTAVDVEAVAFLLAGAVHNLVVSDAYPRPSPDRLRRHIHALTSLIRPRKE